MGEEERVDENLDEFLDWVDYVGQFLAIDDKEDIFKFDHCHHWIIGALLVGTSRLGKVLKALGEEE